jgi:acyl-[acyl-carrier-protein]-phospholipid O-acyltransferase/long-chain-fatty-acid--[acyl-carrier-protein] ligase
VRQQLPPTLLDWLVRKVTYAFARLLYKVKVWGADRLPEGGFLLLPNHLTWVDAGLLQLACPRPIRFIVWEQYYRDRRLQPFLRFFGSIPISDTRAKESIRAAVEAIRSGEVVCIFPEGELSRSGTLLRIKRGYELIARQAKCPVVPAWMDQTWGSIFSYRGGRFFRKWPASIRYPVTVAFAAPLDPREAGHSAVRQRFLELGEFCYQQRAFLKGHLAHACLRGLMREPGAVIVIDGMDGSSLTRRRLLAGALALAAVIRRSAPENRVAIVLPAGKGAFLANLAVLFAGKIPVNLNFTAGRAANEGAIRKAAIRCCITARAFQKRLKDFPWPENVLALEEIAPALRSTAAKWLLLSRLLPAPLLAHLAGIPRHGDTSEAFLLFSSGSSGEPKGILLSHRNLLANARQVAEMLDLGPGDAVLGALPFFHSFGATVCLLYPVIEGLRVITFPNPLETHRCAGLIEQHHVTLLLATPTFLRGYLKRAAPEQLRSVKLVVTGAEKLHDELALAFKARFGIDVMQGYGLTETSPVASVNLPNRAPESGQPTSRLGSAGKLVPGLAAQIRDPDTGAQRTLHDPGMLWFKGPNVFPGYLEDPARTADSIQDGWFRTGDLARFDEDGFLYIEGRLSRFSKIGGEMVPHETVEAKIIEAFALSSEGERVLAVSAVPDEAKGEALVVLTTRPLDQKELRDKLSDAGLPNLWIPRRILPVEKIPVLASGKLDLQSCARLAATAE